MHPEKRSNPPRLAVVHAGFLHRGYSVIMMHMPQCGRTTHMAAALDTRIRLSFPVAGSYPLYLRNKDRGSVGDSEQYFIPLYDENISPDGSGGGVATWLEIYALGGFGEGADK